MKVNKGEFGYVKRQKWIRLWKTLAFFLLPLVLLLVGLLLNHGDRRNIYTVIAMVGCIPACMSAVSMIMMWMQRPLGLELYQEICAHAGQVTMVYELCLTTREKNLFLDAAALHEESILAYTDRETDQKVLTAMEDHICRTLRVENYKVTVKILDASRKKAFLERLDTWGKKQTQDQGTEEAIRDILLAISL